MPKGTRHTVTGILNWDDRQFMHRLDVTGGGYWFADMPYRTRHLLGREITVEGVRSGFNVLDVVFVIAVDGTPTRPRRFAWPWRRCVSHDP